jgi:hypothetical protein
MQHTLELVSGGIVVCASYDSGLRPLFDCINKTKGKYPGSSLHDKVVGLAAARLIVHSGTIKRVVTPLASQPAADYLREKNIELSATQIVPNILRQDGGGLCPMEEKALTMSDSDFHAFMSQTAPIKAKIH